MKSTTVIRRCKFDISNKKQMRDFLKDEATAHTMAIRDGRGLDTSGSVET